LADAFLTVIRVMTAKKTMAIETNKKNFSLKERGIFKLEI
jgi:hypothetical protein